MPRACTHAYGCLELDTAPQMKSDQLVREEIPGMSPHLRVRRYMKCQKGGGGLGIYFFLRISLSILENWALNALYLTFHSTPLQPQQDELVSHNSMLNSTSSWHNWHLDLNILDWLHANSLFLP